ncbi:major capsid protein [Brevundimonas phage vB_BgoS-BabaJaga]|nr:major capsid protein [Brevundimonas phage vB_BsubS-Delta]USN15667.1 major capsid protein [Brevundimonas phage vB_BgoS-BabaJaga]USN16459.1 major capsid protein [Brevundimonas phage vB_BpoS-Poludnitsa]USN16611.1 major capsid protein [Brevundimonas phage vB_BgoS-Fanboy]DAV12568.1 MAG TPA: major capsid protein [Caudoviricetes sp.]
MASVTLEEAGKLAQDQLVQGVIEEIIDSNPMFEIFPFEGIDGNSLAFNRENTLGDVQVLGVGGTITAKNPATFTKVNANLTTILGDAEVNGLIQATRSGNVDQKAQQIASKAKSAARKYQDMMINGTGTGDEFMGLRGLVANSQKISAKTGGVDTNGGVLTFELLDELLDLIKDKDSRPDFLMMSARERRRVMQLLRAMGGASPADVYTMPSGEQIIAYNNVPIFVNDYIPTNLTRGTASNASVVFAGTWDDGSLTHGISGLTAKNAAGISIVEVGQSETKDEEITRVRWYTGLANFSQKGLAMLQYVVPPAG